MRDRRLIALTLALAATAAFAGNKPAPSLHPAATRLALDQPCELTEGAVLGPYFEGHRHADVIKAFAKDRTEPDQYETAIQFEDRIKAAIAQKPAAISTGTLCAVKSPGPGFFPKYEAEEGVLYLDSFVEAPKHWFDGKSLHDSVWLYLGESNRKDSTYTGSNAFGASTEVFKLDRTATYLGFDFQSTVDKLRAAGAGSSISSLGVGLRIPADQARALGRDVHLVFQYELLPPAIGHYQDDERPTMDNPWETHEAQNWIVGRLKKIAVLNSKTGEVLRVMTLNDAPRPEATDATEPADATKQAPADNYLIGGKHLQAFPRGS